jgi:imidazolonepropionase-like amidohydrolase/ABC-type multidrug transport system permease subunit
MVLFFNYLFPLIFFFVFAQSFRAERGGVINLVVTNVLIIGILGNGFFGGGMRAVQDREANILRRFKVAPITALPILTASLVTGLLNYFPAALLVMVLAHFLYGMPVPAQWPSLLLFLIVGIVAFRAMGLIIASVANSLAESQIIVQLMYMPMLFLSGATFPLVMFPAWLQVVAQFLPASYLFTGIQGILIKHETLVDNSSSVFALLATTMLATLLGVKLFRWEKEEKIRGSAKLWLAAVLGPFLILGAWQAHSRDNIAKAKIIDRELRRSRTMLIREGRIFVGDGRVIESGAVLIRDGKIAEIYDGRTPDAQELKADRIEAAGKTILPGLIDIHVHLAAPGGVYESAERYNPDEAMPRALAAYLYCGITAVKSAGDPLDAALRVRTQSREGLKLAAEFYTTGPLFTTDGGHGTEYFRHAPEAFRETMQKQFVRIPATPDEARAQVRQLQEAGVDGIKAILDAGSAGMLFNRMDVGVLGAITAEAARLNLPAVLHTGSAEDVQDALAAGATGIEHGSAKDRIPDELLRRLAKKGVAYDPTLSVVEALKEIGPGSMKLLDRSLVQQVGPVALIRSTKAKLQSSRRVAEEDSMSLEVASDNLRRAYAAGVPLVAGSDAGNLLVVHGPTVQRELQLWVAAGVPPSAALQAATMNNARLLKQDHRIGLLKKGYDANLLVVDGNPLQDISVLERISMVVFLGERVNRADLLQ